MARVMCVCEYLLKKEIVKGKYEVWGIWFAMNQKGKEDWCLYDDVLNAAYPWMPTLDFNVTKKMSLKSQHSHESRGQVSTESQNARDFY